MRSVILSLLLALTMTPAHADDAAKAAKKAEVIKNARQETIALGDNRFLIFSGSPGAYEYAYSIDLVRIDGGVPHFEPLFMDDFNEENGAVTFSEGAAFAAVSYRFDKSAGLLDYTSRTPDGKTHFAYQYQLSDNTLNLQQVMMQDNGAPPQTVYKAADATPH